MKNKDATEVCTVKVIALTKKSELDFDDREFTGEYHFDLPEESDTWTDSQKATYVLDVFHNSVAVAVLDDFSFSVIDPNGREIFEDY